MHATDITWRVDPKVRFRRMLDEAVVIHQENAEALVLNETGISFLELCDGKHTLEEIINELVERYDVMPAELLRDIEAFATELREAGIIEESGSNDA